MKSGFTATAALVITIFLLPSIASADDSAGAADSILTNKADRVSYSVGLYIANNIIKRNGVDVNVDVMAQAVKDVMAGQPKLNDQQAQETLREYETELRAKREEHRVKVAEKNRLEGEQFLAANKQKPGIKTQSVRVSDNSNAELQYKVITEGKGDSPKATDIVAINLKASLISGKEVDTSTNRRTPVNRLPNGLTEALQLMKPGGHWQLFVPSTLAFGDFGSGANIEPGMALVYDLELISVEIPAPLTSDIVMVPSAEQMRAGSNVVTIKPADISKYAETNNPPATPQKAPVAPPKK